MRLTDKARKLLRLLKQRALKNPKVFGENYGEREIMRFRESAAFQNASHREQGDALTILHQIANFSPHDKGWHVARKTLAICSNCQSSPCAQDSDRCSDCIEREWAKTTPV